MTGGHCYGFSVMALRFFKRIADPSIFGAPAVPALNIVGTGCLTREDAIRYAEEAIGFVLEGDHAVCRNCTSPIPLASLGRTGGCNPIPLPSHAGAGVLWRRLTLDLAYVRETVSGKIAEFPTTAFSGCPTAIDSGTLTYFEMRDGNATTIPGRYSFTYQKRGGKWQSTTCCNPRSN